MGQKTVESVAASVRRTVMVLTIAALMTVVLVLMSTGPASAGVKGVPSMAATIRATALVGELASCTIRTTAITSVKTIATLTKVNHSPHDHLRPGSLTAPALFMPSGFPRTLYSRILGQ